MEDFINNLNQNSESILKVVYDGAEVKLGQELKPYEVRNSPKIVWDGASDKFYTLIMYDPKAPSTASSVPPDVKHWIIGNIQGSDMTTGEIISNYIGSGPPKDTGIHKYIFIIFEHATRITYEKSSETLPPHLRLRFSVKEFVNKYELKNMKAANYFVAQWEPYVDERRKQLLKN